MKPPPYSGPTIHVLDYLPHEPRFDQLRRLKQAELFEGEA